MTRNLKTFWNLQPSWIFEWIRLKRGSYNHILKSGSEQNLIHHQDDFMFWFFSRSTPSSLLFSSLNSKLSQVLSTFFMNKALTGENESIRDDVSEDEFDLESEKESPPSACVGFIDRSPKSSVFHKMFRQADWLLFRIEIERLGTDPMMIIVESVYHLTSYWMKDLLLLSIRWGYIYFGKSARIIKEIPFHGDDQDVMSDIFHPGTFSRLDSYHHLLTF